MATEKSLKVNEGDWICSEKDCGNINFAWREKCNKCGKDKGKVDTFKKTGSEIGRQAATKSGGLFSADDWQCTMCGNVNWARRTDCNICKHPKFAKVEARTGLGGGFCDRDDVEYVEREQESDDEYDEFGRKKKQYRAKNGSVSKPPVEEEDEEDEDDDDDDVDLSKYDLVASDDDKPVVGTNSGSSKSHSRSHSPAQSHSSSSRDTRSSRRKRRGSSSSSRDRSRSWSPRRHRDRSRSGSYDRRRSRDKKRKRSHRSRSRDRY